MSKTNQQQEYAVAMRVLQDLCAEHRIKTNDKLREVFWEGVVHGWNRAKLQGARTDAREKKAELAKSSVPATQRDSQVESGAGMALSDAPGRSADVSKAGMFKL